MSRPSPLMRHPYARAVEAAKKFRKEAEKQHDTHPTVDKPLVPHRTVPTIRKSRENTDRITHPRSVIKKNSQKGKARYPKKT